MADLLHGQHHKRLASRRWLHGWHRRIGAIAGGMLLYLVATGLPLQFSSELELGNRHVHQPWVLDWYGFKVPAPALMSGDLASLAGILFRDGNVVAELEGFRGAVGFDGLSVIAGENTILLLDPRSGTMLDQFAQPEGILRIGLHEGLPVIQTPSGITRSDADLVNWNRVEVDPAQVAWADVMTADGPTTAALQDQVRARMLSVERLFQDLHSGRFFGTAGMIVIDVAAALLIFLAISGLVLWWRYASPRD